MRNILIILGGIAAIVVIAVGVYQWQGAPSVPPAAGVSAPAATGPTASAAEAAEIGPDDHVLGRADAPVTVIEYASLTCPHCRNFHEDVLPELKAAYIDTGKVRLAYRDFPLDRAALAASMLARCAGRERYFAFLDLFFARQEGWAQAQDPVTALARLAALGGMAESEVDACFRNEDIQKAILGQRLEAENAFSIDSTPSFVINGVKHSGGAGFEDFKAAIDPLLAEPASN